MAMLVKSTASVRNPNIGGNGWLSRIASKGSKSADLKESVIARYSPDKWLLSHVSIVASVDTDLADPNDPNSNWLIKPEHSIFVNNNGDCWERELLKKVYKTFLGANNYVEHVQIPELAKGKVVDVALREVPLGKNVEGKECSTLYVDLLVATSREHEQLCRQIENGEYNAMSMGCLIQYSICSRCGNKAHDETEACNHVKYYKGNEFYDSNGKKRVIAELCGHKDDPESVKFIDASWVKNPAFPGAVLRNIVSPPVYESVSIKDELLDTLSKNKEIPKDEHHEIVKNASLLEELSRGIIAEDEKPIDDSSFPEPPPVDTNPVDTSPESEKKEEAPAEGGDSAEGQDPFGDLGGEGEEGEGEEKPEVSEEEAKKTPIDQIQEEIQDALLTQVKQNLMSQTRELMDVGTGEGPGRGDTDPFSLENDTNSSLIKEAATKETAHYLWNKYSIDIHAIPNKRMVGALMLSAKVASVGDLRNFGFTRRDVLGLLHFMDVRVASTPLSSDSVEFLSKNSIGGSSKRAFFEDYIISTGTVPDKEEANKVWKWAKLLGES